MALLHLLSTVHFITFRLVPIIIVHFLELVILSYPFYDNPTTSPPVFIWIYAFGVIPLLGMLFWGAVFLREKAICFMFYRYIHGSGFGMYLIEGERLVETVRMDDIGTFCITIYVTNMMFKIATDLSIRQLLRTWTPPGHYALATTSARYAEDLEQAMCPRRQGTRSLDLLQYSLFDHPLQTPKTEIALELEPLLDLGTIKVA